MKLLFVSKEGELLPLAIRAKDEGYQALLAISNRYYAKRGEGIVEQCPYYLPNLGNIRKALDEEHPDIIVCEHGCGEIGDTCRDLGYDTYGACKWTDILSNNPQYSQTLCTTNHLDKMDVCGWWDGTKFSYFYKLIKAHGFMPGMFGPMVLSGIKCSRVLDGEVENLAKLLRKTPYKGMVSVSGGQIAAEFTLLTFAALYTIVPTGIVGFLQGEPPDVSLESVCVRLSVPPYPHAINTHKPQPLRMTEGARKYFWGVDITRDMTAGLDGNLGWASARGKCQTNEAKSRVRRTVGNIDTDDLQCRSDLIS